MRQLCGDRGTDHGDVAEDELLRVIVVYYESINRDLNKRLIFECRCDTYLKT